MAPLDDLPGALASMERQPFFRAFSSDKKHSASAYRLILVGEDGRLRRQEMSREPVAEDVIWASFETARDQIAQANPR
jgi:cation transport regulator ChaB